MLLTTVRASRSAARLGEAGVSYRYRRKNGSTGSRPARLSRFGERVEDGGVGGLASRRDAAQRQVDRVSEAGPVARAGRDAPHLAGVALLQVPTSVGSGRLSTRPYPAVPGPPGRAYPGGPDGRIRILPSVRVTPARAASLSADLHPRRDEAQRQVDRVGGEARSVVRAGGDRPHVTGVVPVRVPTGVGSAALAPGRTRLYSAVPGPYLGRG